MDNFDRTHALIRKISIGSDLKNAMTYQVGTVINGMTITAIVSDQYDDVFLNTKSYIIYITKDGVNDKEWKRVSGLPLTVEYFI